jgi:hypothetical protein
MNHKWRLMKMLFRAGISALFIIFAIAITTASTITQLFFDEFDGTGLGTSHWSVVDGGSGIQITGGLLQMSGGPDHKRIDSIPTFAPMEQSVMSRARIRLAGDYQKFGFRVNPMEFAGPISGYYFDTLSRFDSSLGREHHIRALAWAVPASGLPVNLLDIEIPVTWYEFHEFAIERTPSEVIYSIDGQEVARVADAFADALPVGIWNDRSSLMQTDWVEVSQIIRVITVPIDIKPGSSPNSINLGSAGAVPVAIISTAAFDARTIDPTTVTLAGAQVRLRGRGAPMASFEDVNSDGLVDLVVHVTTEALQLSESDTEAILAGQTFGGTRIRGVDSVRIVP